MKKILDSITNTLYENEAIKKEDIDVCRYGLDVFLSSVLEVLSIFLISLFVHNFLETVLFFTAFIPLRIFAGGYHADTKLRCYFVSLGVYAVFSIITFCTMPESYQVVSLISIVISEIVVLAFAPVIHKNKSINAIEKNFYRKCSICVCFSEAIITLLLSVIFPKSSVAFSLSLGQFAVSMSVISAVLKGKITDNKIKK